MSDITVAYAGLIEQVRTDKMLPEMFLSAPNLVLGLVGDRQKVQNANQRFYRIPFKKLRSGNMGKLDLNYGAFGDGNAFELDNMTAGYFAFAQTHSLNTELKVTTEGNGSVVDAFNEMMAEAMVMLQDQLECILHTNGNGVLTGASSAYGSSVYTFAGGDPLGVNRIIEGATYEVWDSALTTSLGIRRAIAVNRTAKTVTLSSAPTGSPAAGDRLVVRDIDAYGPAAPATHQSTYPATGASGVGGDSFIHGLEYYFDTTAANYVLGKQKSAVPVLSPKNIAGGSNPLTYLHGIRARNILRRDRGNADGCVALFPLSQYEHLQSINMSLATVEVSGAKFGAVKDLAPDSKELGAEFMFADTPARIDLRMSESKVFYLKPENWGTVEPKSVDFWNEDGKGPLYRTLNGDGKMTTGLDFHLWGMMDVFCIDPGDQVVIDDLEIPSGSF